MDTILGSSTFRGHVIGKANKKLAVGLPRKASGVGSLEPNGTRGHITSSTFSPMMSEPIWNELYQEATRRCLGKSLVKNLTLTYELQAIALSALLGTESPRSLLGISLQPGGLSRATVRKFGEAAAMTASALVQTIRLLTGFVAGVLARVALEYLRREKKQQLIILSDGPSVLLYGGDPREVLLRNELAECWDEAARGVVETVRVRRGLLDAEGLADMLDRYYYGRQDFNEAHREVSKGGSVRLSRPQAHRYRARVEEKTTKVMRSWLDRKGVLTRSLCAADIPARARRAPSI
jgi:hypothetical protein